MTIEESPVGIVKAAIEHLLKQGRPAFDREASKSVALCRYRDSDGNACAIGGLIPDEKYHEDMEKGPLATVLRMTYGETPHRDVILAATWIQKAHDKWATYWAGLGDDWRPVEYALAALDAYVPGWREALGREMEDRFLALLRTRQTT